MIFRLIRWPLGQLVLLIDFLTAPRPPQRSAEEQALVDEATRGMALYQFKACPFCVKTRRAMRRLGVKLELRDAQHGPFRAELEREGGRVQVPCLRIPQADGSALWLYESDEIIRLLEQQVGAAVAPAAG